MRDGSTRSQGDASFFFFSYASIRLQFVHGYRETPSIPNLSGRDRPLPVTSVCVGKRHVCVESSEHVAKAIAFQWGNSKYRLLDRSAPPDMIMTTYLYIRESFDKFLENI